MIMLRLALLARLLLTGGFLFYIRFGKRGRRRLLRFQLLDALLCSCQLLMQRLIFGLHRARVCQQLALPRLRLPQLLHHLAESLHELAELLFQLCDFCFLRHAPSLSERCFLNNITMGNQVL